jgi:hypothetical protein
MFEPTVNAAMAGGRIPCHPGHRIKRGGRQVKRQVGKNQNGKRQVVVIARERSGRSVPAVFKAESDAMAWISARVSRNTKLVSDEAPSWNDLHARYEVKRINHQELYSTTTGVYTNGAERYFSRLRRAEIGHHHHVAGICLMRYG